MNLDDIPTPETDTLLSMLMAGGYQPHECLREWQNKSRDLERRLTLVRIALQPFANYACREGHVGEPMCHNCFARESLAQTAPKL